MRSSPLPPPSWVNRGNPEVKTSVRPLPFRHHLRYAGDRRTRPCFSARPAGPGVAYDGAVKFVMVPGGWQGGWVFDAVAAELREDGHQVEAVTLSGLEQDGPADPERPPNPHTHIEQAGRLIGWGG